MEWNGRINYKLLSFKSYEEFLRKETFMGRCHKDYFIHVFSKKNFKRKKRFSFIIIINSKRNQLKGIEWKD